jgi:alcohol-forming fatty acyl-CoA reductase
MSPAAPKTPASKTARATTTAPASKARGAVTDGLTNEHIFLTGATGFVGQAVLERLLSSYPKTRISVLIRAKGSAPVEGRLTQLLRKPVFKGWIESIGGEEKAAAIVAKRVTVINGSLSNVGTLPNDIDVVIHGASTVSFDPPIDEAFDTNVGGAFGVYGALLESGSNPHVVHVSTAYVGGIRKGVSPESSLTHSVDWRAEYEAAKSARIRVENESRQPDRLRGFLDNARANSGKAGPQAVAAEAEAARIEWVTTTLVDFGRTRAESLGWTDVYTLTKAFAERAAEELWAQTGHRLSIVRPSIIESALHHPFPGWIDGFKVADPLILAYGRGLLPDFPGLPDSVLDVIPVDHVVNAIIAAAGRHPEPNDVTYFHVSSGRSNPLPFHEMYENVYEYFTKNPVPHEDGPVKVPSWRFPGGARVEQALRMRENQLQRAEDRISRKRTTNPRRRARFDRVKRAQHDVEVLRGYTDLYRAYVQTEIIFDDRNTRALHASLSPELQKTQGFDVNEINWHDYFQNIHFPSITTLTKAFASRPAAKTRGARALPERSDVVAVFDLEGTVVKSNLVQQYLWLAAGMPPKRWAHDAVNFGFSIPKYIRAERRDRGDFIRTFMRRYKGFKVSDIERLVRGPAGRALLNRVYPEALAQVKAHRDAGHRTILVTGTIDLMVQPLLPYFDEVVAGRMHERDGKLTGYLADPPLVDEARAAWLRHYASVNNINLSQSYGYGDSHADMAWLGLLGNANAVNPDLQLYRRAQEKRWGILDWKRGAKPAELTPTESANSTESAAASEAKGVGARA